jgi:hypothetical protein
MTNTRPADQVVKMPEATLNRSDSLRSRTAEAILRALDAGLTPKAAVRRVAWDSLQEAKTLGWTAAQQAQVVDFVAEVGADLFVAAACGIEGT